MTDSSDATPSGPAPIDAAPIDAAPFDRAVAAAKAGDAAAVREHVQRSPGILSQRDAEQHALFDHALWALLVDDWSRPPTIAPDPSGQRMEIVRLLLDAGADVNGRGAHGWTPLHTALYENHVELTELLIARGADPHAEAHGSGGTPLLSALFWGHAEAADALAARDITPLNLRVAAGLGRVDLIAAWFGPDGELLSGAGAARGYYRPHDDFPPWTPGVDPAEILAEALCYAARNGRVAAVDDLIARGADADVHVYGGTPLHWAASQDRTEICERLLDAGANPSRRGGFGAQKGVTPLHCAAWMDRVNCARLLLDRGADPSLTDETHGGTPLGWAEHMGSPGVAALLRAANPDG